MLQCKFYPHRCTPIECLHTILLGPYKYLLRDFWSKLGAGNKREIEAIIATFPYSGFSHKMTATLHYVGSFVGRDFKIFAQMVPSVIRGYLSESEKVTWLYLSKVT